MSKRNSFVFYYDWWDIFEPMTVKQRGELLSGVCEYVLYGTEPGFSQVGVKIGFNVIKNAIDRDAQKYEAKCIRNAESAKRRWQRNADECERIKTDVINADNDTDNDNDNDNDNDTDNRNDSESADASFSAKTVCVYSEDFLSFWSEYPKKVGKGDAYNKWKKARLTNRDKADILSALKWQTKTDRWRSNNGRYIPNPSTYITQRRWEDEPFDIKPDYTDPSRYTDGHNLPDFIARGEF